MKRKLGFSISKISLLILLMLTSCVSDDPVETVTNPSGGTTTPTPAPDPSTYSLQPGDLVVSSSSNDSLQLLDSDGNFKKLLYDVENTTNTIYGVGWKHDTNEVIFTVDGSDRIMAVSVVDASVRTLISSAFLNGSLRGVTQLTDGSILIVESNNIEKYTTDGVRNTEGGNWPKNLGTTPEQIFAKADGGFGICFRGSDELRLFDKDGTQTHSVASGIAATTDGYGCTELADGTIAGGWLGTTDTIKVYNPTLASEVSTYSDTGILIAPRGIDQAANGNLLVLDSSYHQIYEIDPVTGSFVRIIGGATLSTPAQILVVPSY